MQGAVIDGLVTDLVVNGVEVMPYARGRSLRQCLGTVLGEAKAAVGRAEGDVKEAEGNLEDAKNKEQGAKAALELRRSHR